VRLRAIAPQSPDPAAATTGALLALYEDEREAMVRLARLMTGSGPVAEDLVHDAFVRIHPLLDDLDNPGAYLRRVVINLCRTHHRRRDVEDRWLARQPPPSPVLPPELDETWRALHRLTPTQRHVLVLHFYLDMRLADVAEMLDIPLGTVKSNLHRGVAAVREGLR